MLAGWAERLAGDDWGAGAAWGALFGDALCRRLIMRFLLCRAVLALHTGLSRAPELQPTCFPTLPEARTLQQRIGETHLVVHGLSLQQRMGDGAAVKCIEEVLRWEGNRLSC